MQGKEKNKNLKSFGVDKPALSHSEAVEIGRCGGVKSVQARAGKKVLKEAFKKFFARDILYVDNGKEMTLEDCLAYAFKKNPAKIIELQMQNESEFNNLLKQIIFKLV